MFTCKFTAQFFEWNVNTNMIKNQLQSALIRAWTMRSFITVYVAKCERTFYRVNSFVLYSEGRLNPIQGTVFVIEHHYVRHRHLFSPGVNNRNFGPRRNRLNRAETRPTQNRVELAQSSFGAGQNAHHLHVQSLCQMPRSSVFGNDAIDDK